MTPEGKNVNLLRREVKRIGGLVRKCHWEGARGAPDLFVMLPWGHCWVEMKAENGRLAPHQAREIDRMRKSGCDVRVLYTRRDVESFVLELYEWQREVCDV
jgi:hypothetical protein